MSHFTVIILTIAVVLPSYAQFRVEGNVTDMQGAPLIGAHVIVVSDSAVHVCDERGRFSFDVNQDSAILAATFTGYYTRRYAVNRTMAMPITIRLEERIGRLHDVTVTARRFRQEDVFESTRSSSILLTKDDINAIPVLGGEADVIKALQLMPGTLRGVDGSSDLFVRGGAADQNLVLLDDVPIYNTSHLFGFLSVFNSDVIEKVEAVNGGFPASYGGRLSSVLDISTLSDIPTESHISGEIGTLASRLFVAQPIAKNKAAIWIAARRTYVDQVVKLFNEELPYFFYDINAHLTWQLTDHDKLTLSHYSGEDYLDYFRDRNNDGDGVKTSFVAGNQTQSVRWQHEFSNWITNLTAFRTAYAYSIKNSFEDNRLAANSDITDTGAKFSIRTANRGENVGSTAFGIDWTRHEVSPNVVNTAGFVADLLESSRLAGRSADEVAVYAHQEWSPADKWTLATGLRLSTALTDDKTYFNPEPRFSVRYALDSSSTFKFSYSRMVQYMHRVSSSAVSSPTDIWYPVTSAIAPQTAHQITVAWQRLIHEPALYVSVEAYYKRMENLIGYEEGTNLFFNTAFEEKLTQGDGRAFGLELLARKDAGRFTGWLGYTLSWSYRQFDDVNGGREFFSRYDRRHNGALVVQYALNKRWAFSAVWEFISGSRFTPVIGQYVVLSPTLTGVDLVPIYSGINAVKLRDTHRLDLGIKYRSRQDRNFSWQIFAGVYNVYNRANPVGISIVEDETTNSLSYSQPGLFGLIPFVSFGFEF